MTALMNGGGTRLERVFTCTAVVSSLVITSAVINVATVIEKLCIISVLNVKTMCLKTLSENEVIWHIKYNFQGIRSSFR